MHSTILTTSSAQIWLHWQFFLPLTLSLIFLQPLDLQELTVPYLKDLIHICLEPDAQADSQRFNTSSLGQLKVPSFYLIQRQNGGLLRAQLYPNSRHLRLLSTLLHLCN